MTAAQHPREVKAHGYWLLTVAIAIEWLVSRRGTQAEDAVGRLQSVRKRGDPHFQSRIYESRLGSACRRNLKSPFVNENSGNEGNDFKWIETKKKKKRGTGKLTA